MKLEINTSRLFGVFAAASLGAVALPMVGCEDAGPAEEAGEAIDDAVDDTADALDDAADDVGDAVDDATDP